MVPQDGRAGSLQKKRRQEGLGRFEKANASFEELLEAVLVEVMPGYCIGDEPDDGEAHDAVRRSHFEALLPGRVRYIDAATIANARADRHMIQGRWGGGSLDCLHYCLPGPPDTYNLVLKRLLRESSPPEVVSVKASRRGSRGAAAAAGERS